MTKMQIINKPDDCKYVVDRSKLLKYDPYIQSVRKDIAKMYWYMRRDGKKELAILLFKRQKYCSDVLADLIAYGKSDRKFDDHS